MHVNLFQQSVAQPRSKKQAHTGSGSRKQCKSARSAMRTAVVKEGQHLARVMTATTGQIPPLNNLPLSIQPQTAGRAATEQTDSKTRHSAVVSYLAAPAQAVQPESCSMQAL